MRATRFLRNAIAVLAGIVIGGAVNMAVLILFVSLIPPPPGVDVSNPESLARAMHLFEPYHFISPFLAHALGTFAGALIANLVAATHRARMAYVVAVFFLLGGIGATFMIPAPGWYVAIDLLGAYLPMAWLAIWIGTRLRKPNVGG